MKKKRCEALKNKRAILMAEVRFLRRRRHQLLQIQSANEKLHDDVHSHRLQTLLQHDNQVPASERLVGKAYLTTDIHPVLANVIQQSRSPRTPHDSSSLVPAAKQEIQNMLYQAKVNDKEKEDNMARSGVS